MVAQVYEITMPEAVRITRIGAHQNPITLCQLKSLALPLSPDRNSVTALTCRHVHCFGHHKYIPLSASTRNAALHAPVIARAVARFSPSTDR